MDLCDFGGLVGLGKHHLPSKFNRHLLNCLLDVAGTHELLKFDHLLLLISKHEVLIVGHARHDLQQLFLNFLIDWVSAHVRILHGLHMVAHSLQPFGSEPAVVI